MNTPKRLAIQVQASSIGPVLVLIGEADFGNEHLIQEVYESIKTQVTECGLTIDCTRLESITGSSLRLLGKIKMEIEGFGCDCTIRQSNTMARLILATPPCFKLYYSI